MTPDGELLRQYAAEGSEAAFAELVRRHVDLVYSVALRQAAGDAPLAQDVTQLVFLDLARKARVLSGRSTLAGWLHTSARFAASKAIRSEQRRRHREQESLAMNESPAAAEVNWDLLRPLLDESVGRLNEADRDAIVLRFFQGKTHQEVGDVLGLSENAANKRVERALEKLRGYFAKNGVTASCAIIATAIGANSVQAAPASLASRISTSSLASIGGSLSGGAFPAAHIAFLMNTKTKIVLATVILVLVAIILAIKLLSSGAQNLSRQNNGPVMPTVASTQVEKPVAAPATPSSGPTISVRHGNDFGELDFGKMAYGASVHKKVTLQSGIILDIQADYHRDNTVGFMLGIPDGDGVTAVSVWGSPGIPISAHLINGEMVSFTPLITPNAGDFGILYLGTVDLRGGSKQQFVLKSGRTLVMYSQKVNTSTSIVTEIYSAGKSTEGAPIDIHEWGGYESGSKQTFEFGNEGVTCVLVF